MPTLQGNGGTVSATILVVDDDPYVRRGVERILTRAHYQVITAGDVGEAVRYAQRLPMDCAIVDFDLPDANGLQVLARLRELQPSCLRILMTGFQDYDMVVEAVNCGEVLRVVRKPYDAAGLLQTLADAFQSAERMAQFATAQRDAVALHEKRMLRECLEGDLLKLAIQPIVDVQAPHPVVAYEALLRSLHPQLHGPLSVLRVAERHGQLRDVGDRVFELAGRWLEVLPEPVGLFVNLSADQLGDPERLAASLIPLAGHVDRVTLEITEQAQLTAIERWEDSVALLHETGFQFAVDDLGAGYNSLAILADLQPSTVKIDMSLVRDVHLHERRRRIVETVINLAEATGARVVAEGVECAEEAEVLSEVGCNLLQGYHFGRPSLEIPAEPLSLDGDSQHDGEADEAA